MSFDFKLVDGDISIENSGDLGTVVDELKLIQDILKLLFTATGDLSLHPWYGTPLTTRIIGQAFDAEILSREVSSAIENGLNNLKQLQELQQRDGQFVTAKELISRITTIDSRLDEIDHRKLIIFIEIMTKSGDRISDSFVVSV